MTHTPDQSPPDPDTAPNGAPPAAASQPCATAPAAPASTESVTADKGRRRGGKARGSAASSEQGAPEEGPSAAKSGRGKRRASPARALASSLTGVAKFTATELPAEDRMAPRLSVNVPITALARGLALHLHQEPLFRREATGQIVTVDPQTGDMEPMTAARFVSWAEERVTFTREGRGGDVSVVSLTTEAAVRILAGDVFRRELRPLRSVHQVRLPAWANSERTAVKLLDAGYDAGTQTFTVDGVPYDTAMEPDKAREFLLSTFREFPFARPENDPEQPLEKNRSFAVQMAAMFSTYCRLLTRGGLRPAFAVQANQAGSGKTLLVRMALAPVFGDVTVQSAPRDENELGKLLTATVADGHDYLVVDNLGGFFASAELESFLTSPRRRGRILGQSQTVDAENNLSVFITGNGLHISPDLARRCLLIDLWFAGQVSEREIERPIEEELLASNETRAGFLAAMWALTAHWDSWQCRRSTGARLASFEGFSGIIGGIVTNALFADPIQRPEVRLDETEAAWTALFRKLADDLPNGGAAEYSLDQLQEAAEEMELLMVLIGEPKNPKIALGKRLQRWRGRQFRDSTGRPFEFGQRHARAGSKIMVRNLCPPAEEADGAVAPGGDDLLKTPSF